MGLLLPPTKAFSDALIVGSGNDRVELRYFGRGHTNGDTWVMSLLIADS
jgi:hypothetical protein